MALGAERVASGGVLETHSSEDVAGGSTVDVDAVVGVHLEDAAEALALAVRGVHHVGAGVHVTGVHAEERELTHVGVGRDLEGEGAERLSVVSLAGVGLASRGVGALHGRDVERARQVVDDGVEQLLHALVLVGGAHEDRVELVGEHAGTDGGLELLDGDLLLLEDHLHELVVVIGGGVKELLALLGGDVGELSRNLGHGLRIGHALIVGLEVPRGHGHEVDDTPEIILGAHGDLDGHGVGVQALLHGVDRVEEVGTHAVVLVDEGDARNVEVARLAPHGLGLRLDAGDGVEHGHSAIENTERTLDLGREVHVAGGVDDLDAVSRTLARLAALVPEARGGGGGDGHAALLLLDHPVHGSGALVNLADLVGLAGVVQNALGRGGLTSVDVRHDADVAGLGKVVLLLSHFQFLPELPAVVRERAVGLGHLEELALATLDGSADAVGGVEDLVGEALGHGLLLAGTTEVHDPADGELRGTAGVDLDRNLVGGATDAARLELERGLDVLHGLLEDGQRILVGLLRNDVERTVDDALGGSLLAVEKDAC